MITNKIAVVEIPNRMIANGNQAIDGIVCSPVISGPAAARNSRMRDTRAPMTAPMSTARLNAVAFRAPAEPRALAKKPSFRPTRAGHA